MTIERLLPSGADPVEIEKTLVEDRLVVPDGQVWLLTPKGKIYAEASLDFERARFYMVLCAIICLILLVVLIISVL